MDLMDRVFVVFIACGCLAFLTLTVFMIWIMFNADKLN